MKSIEELRESYNEFIEKQRKGYEMTAAMIGYIVQKMQEASIINGDVSISGRIKSFKSAYENTGKKAVDDCFGIRIVASKEDLTAIEKQLNKTFVVDSKKDHRKKKNTQYNGVHEMLHMDIKYALENGLEPQLLPQIEVQYWSEETKEECTYGDLAYSKYKKSDLSTILSGLDSNPECIYLDLPICYEIKGNNIRRLSSREALYKLYPEIQETEKKKVRKSAIPAEDATNR